MENKAEGPRKKISKGVRKTTSLVQQQTTDVVAVIEPVAADQIQVIEFLLPVEAIVHDEKIRPIVGVITESYSEDVANVKRKKSLRKLESPELVPWENMPNALVFARKK